MQRPHLKTVGDRSVRPETPRSGDPTESGGFEWKGEEAVPPRPDAQTLSVCDGAVPQVSDGLLGLLDVFDAAVMSDPADCEGHIARARALYQMGDSGCEADYRAAFLLDASLAAQKIVLGLADDVLDDVAYVLMNCRKRLKLDAHDLVARVRAGLTLLLLDQDAEAYCELQQVFLQSVIWRPFLRLLVNEAKQWRGGTTPTRMQHEGNPR
jgi:hypothetical protein